MPGSLVFIAPDQADQSRLLVATVFDHRWPDANARPRDCISLCSQRPQHDDDCASAAATKSRPREKSDNPAPIAAKGGAPAGDDLNPVALSAWRRQT